MPSAWTCALVANQEKTLDAVKLAKALEDFKLPPEVALMPNKTFYRAGDHQLMPTLYVGHAVEKGPEPEDLFHGRPIGQGRRRRPAGRRDRMPLKWPGLIGR